jgi:hypothetical protein
LGNRTFRDHSSEHKGSAIADAPTLSPARRKLCRRPKCKTRYGKDTAHFSFPALGSAPAPNGSRNPIKPGIKSADFDDRPWHIVAGPPLTPNQFHCATVADGPDCQWKGGEYERLEGKNRAALRAHFRELAEQCLIQPHHPPADVLGGYRFPGAPTIDLSPLPADDTLKRSSWTPCAPSVPVADDLSIPDFLKREPAAVSESPDGILEAAERPSQPWPQLSVAQSFSGRVASVTMPAD